MTRVARRECNLPAASDDRRNWLSSADLQVGEYVKAVAGRVRVVSTRHLPGVERLYNLEVEGEHVYYVSRLGALAHNQCAVTPPTPSTPSGPVFHGTDSASAGSITSGRLDAGKANQAAGGAGMDPKGFSVTPDRETAQAWAEARAAERGGDPVVLQANGSDLPLSSGRPGEWTDPNE